MTFPAPAPSSDSFLARVHSLARFRNAVTVPARKRIAAEDGAREALGPEASMPVAAMAGASMEDLARIALG